LCSKSGTHVSSYFLTLRFPGVLLIPMRLKGTQGLELVRYDECANALVTCQLALHGKLTVPLTVERAIFWGFSDEIERHHWLERCARTLLDIYGDARDGRVLSDHEVQQRAAA
jgi:hypothetical protein